MVIPLSRRINFLQNWSWTVHASAGKPLEGIVAELAVRIRCYGAVQPVKARVRELWVVWSTLLPGVTLIELLIAGDDVQVNNVVFREVFIDPSASPSIM